MKKQGGARPGAGRKNLFDDPVKVGVTFPREWLDFIPGENRAGWIRESMIKRFSQELPLQDLIKLGDI